MNVPELSKELAGFENFGVANGWQYVSNGYVPEQVKECNRLGHKRKRTEIGRCLHRIWCPICKYYYDIDSSG